MPSSSGPVTPSAGARAALRPLGGVLFRLQGEFWGVRQQLVGERALPHALEALERSGRLGNLTPDGVAGRLPYSGDSYADSDVYKTMEALLWEYGRQPSAALARTVSGIAEQLAQVQHPDGYLHSWFQRPDAPSPYSDPQMGHELYCAAHLIQAAVAEQAVGASFGVLPVAVRLADHLVERARDPAARPLCGHPLIEMALVELYRVTGTASYLDLAAAMVDQRGQQLLGPGVFGGQYYQDLVPVRDAPALVGHCVRALYLACGVTDVYLETGDPTLLRALVRQWDELVATKTYITGGVGCRRKDESFGAPYELPPDHAFAETCAGVAMFQWAWRMLLATGDAGYADMMERLLFNLLPAGLSQDGTAYSYTNTLHRRRDSPEYGDKRTRRQAWFRCPCCPPNLMRLIASLGAYVLTCDGDGVQVHQYLQGSVQVGHELGNIGLALSTAYPNNGSVRLGITATPAEPWSLSLRIPSWCRHVSLTVSGEAVTVAPGDDGYLRLVRRWRTGDVVLLDLSVQARLTWPAPQLDGVRGCVAVERGPVVLCLEQVDLGDLPLETVAVDAGKALDETSTPLVVKAFGVVVTEDAPRWPYVGERPGRGRQQVCLTLTPYYAWGNRDDGPMRVWLPVS